MEGQAQLVLAVELGITSIKDALEHQLNITTQELGDELLFLCPNPGHNDTRMGNCSINSDTGLWHCLACGVGGDLVALGTLVWNTDRHSATRSLRSVSPSSVLSIVQQKLSAARLNRRAVVRVPESSTYEDGPLVELEARGLSRATLERWGVKYVPEQQLEGSKNPFTIRKSIGLPVRDERGQLMAWCYRRTAQSPEWQPRYLYSAPVKSYWFGAHLHRDSRDIVIVEGAIDAMWLDQCGVPALGMLGSSMAGSKVSWLKRFESVTLLGDRDAGGMFAVRSVGEKLADVMPIKVARYPSWTTALDPAELSAVDLEIILARSKYWTDWDMSSELGLRERSATSLTTAL